VRVTLAERRARLAVRHHLAPSQRAGSPEQVAHDLVGLHATDPASVYLSVTARLATPAVAPVEHALYEARSLVRMLGMRRTMFVVTRELAPLVQAACTTAIARQERRRLLAILAEANVSSEPAAWLEEVEQAALDALAYLGEATAAQLGQVEPRLRQPLLLAQGKSYAARQSVSTRVLFLLAAEGRLVRGRPRGSWISSQFRWSTIERWLGSPLAPCSTSAAQIELVRRWLVGYAPGTLEDLRWWTGLTAREVKQALAQLPVVELELDGASGVMLDDQLEPIPPPEPWVALLPALDPAVMGWAGRGWFLGPHAPALFDRTGNVGPTVWSDGRIVGGWAQRSDGVVRVRLLEDVGQEAAAAIAAAAEQLGAWLGPVRVTPRFRTPLERELSS
jgi:Winged helix DNA-binding domain